MTRKKTILKTLGLVAAGFVAGLILAAAGTRQQASRAPLEAATLLPASSSAPASGGGLEARLDALEQRLLDLVDEIDALHALLEADAPSSLPVAPSLGGGVAPAERMQRFSDSMESVAGRSERRATERLLAAGFTPERIEWINRRREELAMEAVRAQYEAQRAALEPGSAPRAGARSDPDVGLRAEMGDAEYERYLSALGRPTTVNVGRVLAGSPAEQAGLRAGDEIVAYGGRRVFGMGELNDATLEGQPDEWVTVDVVRDGQTMQLALPRGPLGITAGGRWRGRGR